MEVNAATGKVKSATITTLLVDQADFGGCMVELSVDPQSILPGCSSDWVTLDCLAVFPESTKSIAQTKLSQAQIAFVANRRVRVYLTDARKANGYCLATRIDVFGS